MKNENIKRICIYLIGTGAALSIPASLTCMDLLLLRMHIDLSLFGAIKSSMFFLPPIAYFFAAGFFRRIHHNEAICRWSYLARILIPFFLPLIALLTDNVSVRLWSCVVVFSLSFTVAMFANNTLLNLYHETIKTEDFNEYSLFFTSLLSVPCMIFGIPAMYLLGRPALSDGLFFFLFFILEIAAGLFYIPAFISLRKLKIVQEPPPRHKLSWRRVVEPLFNKTYLPLLSLNFLQALWIGIISSYWVIFLLRNCSWNAGSVAVAESVLCAANLFFAKKIGKLADIKGYRFCLCVMTLILLAVAILQAFFCQNLIVVLLFIAIVHNGIGIFASADRSLLSAASVGMAKKGFIENYLASFTLLQSLGSFIGCWLASWLLKMICGNTAPLLQDFKLYFMFANLLLIPQLTLAFCIKKSCKN